jgi:tetratricopeptide (TPR) repeat protein
MAVTLGLALFIPDGAEEGRSGNELFRQGKYAEAVTAYRQGLARMTAEPSPIRAALYNNLGAAQYQLEKFGEARQAFDDGIAVSTTTDDKSRLAYNAGNGSFREENLEDALAYYREALLADPDNASAKFNYEFVKRRLDEQGSGEQPSDESQNEQEENPQGNNDDQNQNSPQNQQNKQGQQDDRNQQQQDQQNRPEDQTPDNQHQQQQNQQNRQQDQGNQDEQSNGEGAERQSNNRQSQGGDRAEQQQERQLSQEEALRILQALEDSEENLLRRMSPRQKSQNQNVEKDW